MRFFARFLAVFSITLKRMLTQRWLMLANGLGVISAIALTMSIPIYADAVYQSILESEILPAGEETSAASAQTVARPAFAFMYRYIGSWAGTTTWEKIQPVDGYLSQQIPGELKLNSRLFVRYLKTEQMLLFPGDPEEYKNTLLPLDYLYLANLTGQENHIALVEGRLPKPASAESSAPLEALMREERAVQLGVQPGATYTLVYVLETPGGRERVEFPLTISGIWRPADPREHYWFYSSQEFDSTLLIPEESLFGRVLPAIQNQIGLAVWYWIMDPSTVQSTQVPALLSRIERTRRAGENALPKLRLDISPEDALWKFQAAARSLTIFLYAFSVPLLVMILIFVSLVMNMAVSQRRNEIAVLRSRGSTIPQLISMALLEGVFLVGIGLAAGAPLAIWIAEMLGRARSFLDFSSPSILQPQVNTSAIRFGIVAGLISVAAQALPTFGAARNTIVNYKVDQARTIHPPWWQRAWLDLLLMVPAGYGIYLLRYGGAGLSYDPFQNPLLLLIPSLAIFALILFMLRLLPLAMRLIAWFAGRTKSVAMLMASRTLARTPGGYSAPLILLAMTLSLTIFTATMAQTLDHHTYDHTYYNIGSDVAIDFVEELSKNYLTGIMTGSTGSSGELPSWVGLPASDHLKIPSVVAAARVARTTAQLRSGGQSVSAQFLGIDRIDFPRVAFWRNDFASESLGALMNTLAGAPENVLISRDLAELYGLREGDGIMLQVNESGAGTLSPFRVAEVVEFFPTWYANDGPLIVGNLDYLFEQVGRIFPYDVWLKTAPDANYTSVEAGVENLYNTVLHTRAAPVKIISEQQRPERQGFFGLLSVGFSALSVMSVIGFLLYTFFSFRQRFVELGVLRSIGLSTGQMLGLLSFELAFLFFSGLAAGTGLGVWISDLFIPYLQVGDGLTAQIPPFMVQINWLSVYRVYALFILLWTAALVILAVLLSRMKIFQALKLGEVV